MNEKPWIIDVQESELVETDYPFEINIPELRVVSSKHLPGNDEYFLVYCEPKDSEGQRCPRCSVPTKITKNGAANPRIVLDVKLGMDQVDLKVSVPKYHCYGCDKDFSHRFKEIPVKRNMTNRLYKQFKWMSFVLPFDEVAMLFHISETTVRNAYKESEKEFRCMRGTVVSPDVLGLYNKTIGRSNSTILLDAKSAELVDIYYGKNKDVEYPVQSMTNNDNIHIVIMDLVAEYRSVIQKISPEAKIVVHQAAVQKLVCESMAKVGRKILRKVIKKYQHKLKLDQTKVILDILDAANKDPYLFYTPSDGTKENAKRKRIIDNLCELSVDIAHLCRMENIFAHMYPRSYSASNTREYTEDMYNNWRSLIPLGEKGQWAPWQNYWASADLFTDLIPVANLLDSWKNEILGYVEYCEKHQPMALSAVDEQITRASLFGRDRNLNRIRDRAIYWPIAMKQGRGYHLAKKNANTNNVSYMLYENSLTEDEKIQQVFSVEETSSWMMLECIDVQESKFYKLISE